MTVSVRRRTSFSRALVALGGMGLLALLALAALLLGGALSDGTPSTSALADAHATTVTAAGETDHGAAGVNAIHQQLSTRARSVAYAVLAAAVVVAAWAFRRLRLQRAGPLRTLRVAGLPPGRGPPALRIV